MDDAHSTLIVEGLVRLRHRIAPAGSWREAILRAAYVPLVNRAAERAKRASYNNQPSVTVRQWTAPTVGMRAVPPVGRILVLKLDHLGDFILALPAFTQLRQAFPTARITLVCGTWNRSWAEQSGLFDEVVCFDFFTTTHGEWRGATEAQYAAFAQLELGSFDLAVDLRHDPDTRALLFQAVARYRAGFCAPAEAGGDRLDLALPDMEHVSPGEGTGRPIHAQLRLSLLVSAIAGTFRPPSRPGTQILKPASERYARRRPYAVIAPGAGSPIRCWSIERFAAVAKVLCSRFDLDVVITGGRGEVAAGRALFDALSNDRVVDLTARVPLSDLPGLVAEAVLYVGLDSGTTHLAASLGVPTVAVTSGVPNLEVWHASGQRVIIVSGEAACSPCHLTHAPQCPFGVACLNAIEPHHVISACETLLHRTDAALTEDVAAEA